MLGDGYRAKELGGSHLGPGELRRCAEETICLGCRHDLAGICSLRELPWRTSEMR